MAPTHSAVMPTAWHGAGARVPCVAGNVFVRTEGDVTKATPILLLHGFPTSSHDFVRVWSRLGRARPLVTLDFLGFGMSDKPADFGYGLHEQADVVEEVLAKLGAKRAHVVAHDMGTSVATELCARRERKLLSFEVASLTLANGSVFIEMAHLQPAQKLLRAPTLGPMFAKLGNYPVFRRSMRRLFAEPDSIEDRELREMWELVSRAHGSERLAQAIRYVEERSRFERRWIGALERLNVPTMILWGAKDPVAVLPIGEKLARTVRGSRLRVLPLLGHYPQLEGPDAFAGEVSSFLDELT
jgi:pimeloyl-ACP methyl ester carboxylesterase